MLQAAAAGRRGGLTVWALTGRAPNPLAGAADDAVAVDAADGAVVQELHLVAVHVLCEAFDDSLLGTWPVDAGMAGSAPGVPQQTEAGAGMRQVTR